MSSPPQSWYTAILIVLYQSMLDQLLFSSLLYHRWSRCGGGVTIYHVSLVLDAACKFSVYIGGGSEGTTGYPG